MAWETEFTGTTPDGRRVAYKTNALAHHSHAERPDRVMVSRVVCKCVVGDCWCRTSVTAHTGWVSDGRGFAEYQRIQREGYVFPA